MRVLVALAVAIGLGVLIAASGSAPLLRAADFVAPIGTLWVNAIRMTVIPLVVSLLVTGVASATDVGAIGRLGARTLLVFALMLAATAAVIIPLAASLFALLPLPSATGARATLPAGAAEAANQLAAGGTAASFSAWLTSLIPPNPVAAAANGALVPLILFTLILAIAIARSPESTRTPLVGLARALGDVMLRIVRWVVLAAPIGVFALVLPLAAHLGGAVAGAIGVYIAAYSIGNVVVILLLYPVVAIFGGVPIGRFARAALPAQLIAFSSSSSIASLPALIESGERGLSLPSRITGFVLPLAVSTFKLRCAGVVDGWRAVRRLVLRRSAPRDRARDGSVRVDLSCVRGAWCAARSVHHARATLPRDRTPSGGHRHLDRSRRSPGHHCDDAQRHGRSGGGRARGEGGSSRGHVARRGSGFSILTDRPINGRRDAERARGVTPIVGARPAGDFRRIREKPALTLCADGLCTDCGSRQVCPQGTRR